MQLCTDAFFSCDITCLPHRVLASCLFRQRTRLPNRSALPAFAQAAVHAYMHECHKQAPMTTGHTNHIQVRCRDTFWTHEDILKYNVQTSYMISKMFIVQTHTHRIVHMRRRLVTDWLVI